MGGVRTALFNYLFTRKHNGTMILRIEDTDQNRYVRGAEEYIMESLAWCGIEIDEGVREGGEFGPYRQSERKELYKDYVDQLVETGWAYYAFDTPEELEDWRDQDLRPRTEDLNQDEDLSLKSWKFSYDGSTRMYLKNSLRLTADEVDQLINDGVPYVVRFKFPDDEEIVMQDLIRGEVRVNSATVDDKVLFKSDGMPTYHLANVVDDHLMKISHVIRGEEWLPSLPLHFMLYRAFGWTDTMPQFAHLPLILKPAGNGKLSKRDGDKLGFPVFPINWQPADSDEVYSGYRESGYLPDAFVNLLALLGWNPGTEQEIFSMDELIETFSLERVGKSGSRFDPEKAKSINHTYIQDCRDEELADMLETGDWGSRETGKQGIRESGNQGKMKKVVGLVKERMHFLTDFGGQASFFFERPETYDPKMTKKAWKENTTSYLLELNSLLKTEDPVSEKSEISLKTKAFRSEVLENEIKSWINEKELGMGQIMQPLRLALVGAPMGPAVFDIMEVLGREETVARIEQAIEKLG